MKIYTYSRLSLSRLRLSRITASLEVKIWSLLKHESLTTGNKILWKRGEIAPKEHYSSFPQSFQYISTFKSQITLFIYETWLFDLFFPEFCRSDMSMYGYLEVF